MPIYEYVCQRCGHELEVMQKINDPHLQTCPKCNAKKLTKKMSNSSFVLKGTGWYKTDYPSSSSGTSGSPTATKSPKAPLSPGKESSSSTPKKDAK